MDINFEYYKIFYYVAKYKNITKAATALGSNQPNITRIMKLLEAQLQCRLLVREVRGVSLTEAGQKLFAHVEVAYQQLIKAQEEIGAQELDGKGTVEIGATETALHLFLLEELPKFREQYPKIRIKIHNHTTPEIIKNLINGRLDFAVITTPFKVPVSFVREDILTFQEILAGGAQYHALCNRQWDLQELKGYPWIGLGTGTSTYELYKDYFIKHQVDIELDMEAATSDLLLPLLQNNMGIGFVPDALAKPLLLKKRLVQIELTCELPKRAVTIISDKGRARTLAADHFYKFILLR